MTHPTTLSADEQARLLTMLKQDTVFVVATRFGVSREALAKLAAGLSVRAGSVAIVRQFLNAPGRVAA